MTTVSRTSQVTHSSVTGGGDWDHRLNRLLEDLQETVVPSDSQSGGTEYREYRMSSSTRTNDQPPLNTDEKWVEYGTRGGGTPLSRLENQGLTTTSSSSSSKEKTFGFSASNGNTTQRTFGVDPGLKDMSSSQRRETSQIEYLSPVNTTTVMKSGGSPLVPITTPTVCPLGHPSSSPKVERKEFYAKASYTTLIKGGADGQVERIEEFPALRTGGVTTSTSESQSRREYKSSTERSPGYRAEPLEPPMFSSTPVQSSSTYSSSRLTTDRSVTPPPRPSEGLKTPPLIRKIMQQSQQSSTYSKEVTSTSRQQPYEPELPATTGGTQYYTSTTTRAETREREASPARRFPSPQPPKPAYGEPPKRLDELLATFDESYTETSKISGDGGGPWKSHPYGPGTQPPIRTVRIDDNVQSRSISSSETDGLIQRKPVAETRNVSGPPVFYPPGQIFGKTEEGALMAADGAGKGKAKMKMDKQYKAKEKSKESHSERGGSGVAPVPVCLPVCCAAPCTIM